MKYGLIDNITIFITKTLKLYGKIIMTKLLKTSDKPIGKNVTEITNQSEIMSGKETRTISPYQKGYVAGSVPEDIMNAIKNAKYGIGV